MKYLTNIIRNKVQKTALVEIFKIEKTEDFYKIGEKVACYETASRGATRSAEKTVRQLNRQSTNGGSP